MKKTIAIVSDYALESQPRVLTEINALKGTYHIILFGQKSKLEHPFIPLKYLKPGPNIQFHFGWPVLLRKSFSALVSAYMALFNAFKKSKSDSIDKQNKKLFCAKKPDLVILHGVPHAKWVSEAANELKIPFVINLHEYYPLEFEDNAVWMKDVKPVYDEYIQKYFTGANAHFVVCNGIIKKYKDEFGLQNQILIRNTKPFFNLNHISHSGNKVRMIHHGVCNRSRKIELTIRCMKFLPANYSLDLMLVPDNKYYPELVSLAKEDLRIKFIPTVPTTEIIPFINSYDLGLFLLPPSNFNYLNALPNKLFEFIQARLAIVVSPNPEMKQIVENYDLGAVSTDYTSEQFAKAILSIDSDKINGYKTNTHKAAAELNDEQEQKNILNSINSLLCAA